MQPLDRSLRNKLERTIREARDVAEAAARAALEHLGVAEVASYAHLSADERELRRKLRVHGRQLGDTKGNNSEKQSTTKLIEEIAYEHWHRMLFARFLAENNLLMYPDPTSPVPVSLEECEDLALEEGARNGWELASRFAGKMLPRVFRTTSPVFRLTLPPEHQQTLERLIADLSSDVFTASDSLGWVYQYWQAKRKEEINASGVKIGSSELSAVTQLFTEPYMVAFLLDNSLGAWWARKRLSDSDLRTAQNEDDLRQKASLPNLPLTYLRFVKDESNSWVAASGWFEKWPTTLKGFSFLDPCCGSGHFLVSALLMLVPMRMELEKLTATEAIDAVIKENLHGLEIDPRCVEIAVFAVALAAWSFRGSSGYRALPDLNIACSGLSIAASKDEWLSMAGFSVPLRFTLERLYDQFSQAPTLGSLLDPVKAMATGTLLEANWDIVGPLLEKALASEGKDEMLEMGIVAQGLAKAAMLLSKKHNWVITNVPYLSRGKQSAALSDFCEAHFGIAKSDLATVFLERCLELCCEHGTSCVVLPQNWLFLTSYRKFRENLLKTDTCHFIARLGAGAFETISGEVVKAILVAISRDPKILPVAASFPKRNLMRGIDVSESGSVARKAELLAAGEVKSVSQAEQLENPDCRIALSYSNVDELISKHADTATGLQTFDRPRFIQYYWERVRIGQGWELCQSTVMHSSFFGGCEFIVLWESGKGQLFQQMEDKKNIDGYTSAIWRAGSQYWGKKGILVSLMGDLPVSLYAGNPYDQNAGLIKPSSDKLLSAIWAYCSSNEFSVAVREVDQSLKVTNATLGKIPIDLDFWQSVAEQKYPNGLPKPFSDDPTQWVFHGHPCGSVTWNEKAKRLTHEIHRTGTNVLQIAVARLLGYQWPTELDPQMELSDESREWVRMVQALNCYADKDGIVCIPVIGNEASAADRLLNILAVAYGNAWNNDKLAELMSSADNAGKTLEVWLRDRFFSQHCRLFQNRPFIWQIWDGLKDGFSVLVNYHKLDRRNLETLTYTYLGEWMNRQKADQANKVDGAEEKLAAAEALKKRLEQILEGEKPNDIFVRWKSLEKQAIGWNPDLNDGVRLNIRPFMSVADVGRKGAGILREKPNIKWDKDRGQDVASTPWFHVFNGERINDHHLSLDEKKRARAKERGQ